MLPALLQRIELTALRFLPMATAVLFVIAGVVAWPLPYMGSVTPELGLIAVYYWAVYRPDLFRPLSVFVLGLLHDILHFLPLGLSALIFVALHQLALSQRRFFVRQSFVMLWAGFALIAVMATMGNWLILSLYNKQMMTFLPVFLQAVLTIALFPLPAWVLIQLQRVLLSQNEPHVS